MINYNTTQLNSKQNLKILNVNEEKMLNNGNGLHFKLPLALQLEITSNCNLKCPFCYNSSKYNKTDNNDLTPDVFTKLVKDIVESGGIFQCIISGGEPTLVINNFLGLLDILKKDGTSLALISNGAGINEETINSFRRYDWDWVQISIDSSNGAKHDAIRGVSGTYKQAIKAISLLKKNHIPLIIASVISDYNIEDMTKLVELAIENGAKEIIFSEVIPSGRASTQKFKLSESNAILYQNTITELKREYENDIIITKAASYKEQLLYSEKYVPLSCIVRPNGDVKLDCVLPFVIGNITKENFLNIWENAYRLVQSTQFKSYIKEAINHFISVVPNNVNQDIYFMED